MPYAMPFGEQKDKWFSILIIIGLPFYVFFLLIKKELPHLEDVGPKIS